MISNGGDAGLVSKRKRIRGKVGDPSKHPELKMINGFNLGPATMYTGVNIYGTHPVTSAVKTVWSPHMLQWPAVGAESYERIGKRIRVKMLRLKGCLLVSPFLIMQVRWRIVLNRCLKNYELVSGTEVEKYDMDWVKENYMNFHPMTYSAVEQQQEAAYLNYYATFFSKEAIEARELKRRILVKGVMNPASDIGNYTAENASVTGTIGDTNVVLTVGGHGYEGRFQHHIAGQGINAPVNMYAAFPIDVTVEMNDNVDCELYRYVLQIETDTVIGQNVNGSFSTGTTFSNFLFFLIPHIYYTDE